MQKHPWLYTVLIIFLFVSFPIVLIVSAGLGLALDFDTTWGSNFQDESIYMLGIPCAVLVGYSYAIYWLFKKRKIYQKNRIITEYKQETAPSNIVVAALNSVPNMSFTTLQQTTNLSTEALQQELDRLQKNGEVALVQSLDRVFYTLPRK